VAVTIANKSDRRIDALAGANMIKQEAVASLGEDALVRPGRVREALKANDRLKLYLSVLQGAVSHAGTPERAAVDLAHEIAAADIRDRDESAWLRELPALAARVDDVVRLPGFERLLRRLQDDLTTMARPVLDDVDADPALAARVASWQQRLQALSGDALDDARMADLTRGRRDQGDSLHLLVIDLHKALNRIASRLKGETIAGAHTWHLSADGSDRPRVEAFMRGIERTRALKLDHPGLDTSATRDEQRLLIQNDIGTNDAHVLVLQVEARNLTLTYSDLHRTRFEFFQRLLGEIGAQWSDAAARTSPQLNHGEAYQVGTARWQASDEAELLRQLEAVGARIVFLIDWNRARKRLQFFVGRDEAVAVLHEAAQREVGHMAWLAAGGERLVWNTMAAQGEGQFRLGDRLDDVLGADAASAWLLDLLVLASQAVARHQPVAYVSDEARLLLGRRLQGRQGEAQLLQEHAAWCHALAQALRDGLAHGIERDAPAATQLATQAKGWERQADELVVQARARAERQPAAQDQARLLERADDVADSLEEACFVLSLIADGHHHGWGQGVRSAMQALADAVLSAVQEHVKAVSMRGAGDIRAADQDQAIDALWRVVQAERQCDELLRSARRALAREVNDATSLMLGNELAAALELASDHLLAVGHALRRRTLAAQGALS
jgi:uncharacterized protein Yka (UPF0111/DUF47 family)